MENKEETPKTAMISDQDPKDMKAVMAAYLQQSGKKSGLISEKKTKIQANREQYHIMYKMSSFVESKEDFWVESKHVKVAGFEWYLDAIHCWDDCRFTLFAVPKSRCQFSIDIS